MEEYIINILEKYDLKYVKIENNNSLAKIYNLFKSNIFEEPSTVIEYLYCGVYYDTEENYDLMKKYYLMAINLNHSDAMYYLALYYEITEENYDLMKKYYLMAIKLNNSSAMSNLADYYEENEKNYDLMKKYCLMAIELNNSDAMDYLADYYEKNEKNNQSFVELYKYEDNFINLFNDKFKDNINLDQKYYYSFLQWKGENRSNIVKMKQYILRKTNIFPKNYDEKYLIHFIEFISLKNTKLPKDILNLIAGHLFI